MKSKKTIELDDAFWAEIEKRKEKISRDEFIEKIIGHALRFSQEKFGERI